MLVGVVGLAAVAGFALVARRGHDTPDATPAPPPTSQLVTPPSVAPPPTTAPAAPCADDASVARAAGDDFAVDGVPPAGSVVVFQFVTDEYVVAICREPTGAFWYFAHRLDDPRIGVLTPATVGQDGLRARYPRDPAAGDLYLVNADGVHILRDGTVLQRRRTTCASPTALPAGLVPPADTPACTPDVVVPWSP